MLLLAGLTQVVTAQQARTERTEELVVTKDTICADGVDTKKLTIQASSAYPTDTIDISLGNSSQIDTITVESGKTRIHFSENKSVVYTLGTITVAKDAELILSGIPQTLSIVSVSNEGQFTDETGSKNKILGPAGLWIKEIAPISDIIAPDSTQIKGVSLTYERMAFRKKLIVEIYQNGRWVNYDEIKGSNSGSASPELRSTQGKLKEWFARATYNFTTAIKGTYRFKIETSQDSCKTTWYSKPFELIASDYEIKDDQLTMGVDSATTILPSLLITAGKDGEEVKEATLNNIEITEHTDGTASVKVDPNAKVNLTLAGTNDLGSIELGKGSAITLKPDTVGPDMNKKLSISSVRNGGSFTDETGTVSYVKDLDDRTMIQFMDTFIYRIEGEIGISLKAVGNSLDGNYELSGEGTIEQFVEGEGWQAVPQKSGLRADDSAENPNQSAYAIINFIAPGKGLYRIKITSTDMEDEAHTATLYCLFNITDLNDSINVKTIDGETVYIDGNGEYKDVNKLLFTNKAGDPIKVTLNDVQVKKKGEYEPYSVVSKEQECELTLNGENDLSNLIVDSDATVTLKKGDSFKSLDATVYNGGKFIDETGTIQQVMDLNGWNMISITGYEMPVWNGYILVTHTDSYHGDYAVVPEEESLECLVDGEWTPYHNSLMRSSDGTSDEEAPESGEYAYTYMGLEAGQYRIKVCAEKWNTDAEIGEANQSATLYHYFSIAEPEPEPEPTYYSITLPSVEGATTSPAAGTYWENEGSSFSFSLTLDPAYDQSQPIVKVNGKEVTPDGNGAYTIASIYEDITVTIEGITENTPTDNAEIEENDVKVWASDGQLHLSVPSAEHVWIYAFNGSLVRSLDEIAGDVTVSLNKGSYIIVIGDKRYKIAL